MNQIPLINGIPTEFPQLAWNVYDVRGMFSMCAICERVYVFLYFNAYYSDGNIFY